MSYSLNTKCGICTKKDKCTDRNFIRGAIDGIHSIFPPQETHLGSGSIDLNCQNLVEKVEDKKFNEAKSAQLDT